MSKENKWREFFAHVRGDWADRKTWKWEFSTDEKIIEFWDDLHLVEKAAFEKCQDEKEELTHTLHNVIKNGLPSAMLEGSCEQRLRMQIESLKADLESAVRLLDAVSPILSDLSKDLLSWEETLTNIKLKLGRGEDV